MRRLCRTGLFLAAALCLVLHCPPTAVADSVIKVAFTQLPPWKTIDDEGHLGGIDIEFLRLLAGRMGLAVRCYQLPFKRAQQMLAAGELDMMTNILKRPDRELYLHFIEPPYRTSTNKAFFVLKGHERQITAHDDLRRFRIGTQLGSRYYPAFDNDSRIRKIPVKTTELNIKMLLAKRIDAFIMTESSGEYLIAKAHLQNTIVKADFIYTRNQNVYLVLSKKSPFSSRLKDFQSVMSNLLEEGMYERLKRDFFKTLSLTSDRQN